MKPSTQIHHRLRLAIIGLVVLAFVLLGSSHPLATQKKPPQEGWQVQVAEGKTTRATLIIGNRCQALHQFNVENKAKYVRFEQATKTIPIGPAASTLLSAEIDASKLRAGVHHSQLVVKCLDCKKEKGCTQDRDEVPVEVTVVGATVSTARMSRSAGWGLCCTLVGTGDKLTCAPPATNQFGEVVITGRALTTLHHLDEAILHNTTANFFSADGWKIIFPNLDRFPKQLNLLRDGLPLLRFESPEKGVVRYLATHQSREQIVNQMQVKKKTPIQGVEFCLTVRPK